MDPEKGKSESPLAAMQSELATANRRILLDDQLLEALKSFEQIMAYRNEMYLRLSQRVRTTVRGGMAVFAMVGIAMFVLLITLVTEVDHARTSSTLLAQYVGEVARDMVRVESSVKDMEDRMQKFTSIGQSLHVMTGYTDNIATGMQGLDNNMVLIRGQMSSVNKRLDRITQHMNVMGRAVNGMGHSMNEVARPAGMFQ